MRRLIPLTVLLFAGLAGPASAALTLSTSGSAVTVAGTDADETVTITGDGSQITFAVPSGTITTSDCSGSGASVTCTASAATVDLGGGDDTLISPAPLTTSFPVTVNLATGRDRLDLSDRGAGVTASPASVDGSTFALQGLEDILGTPQDDTLNGNNLPNRLQGTGGSDRLQGGLGEDRLEGGAGADTLRDTGGFDYFEGDAGDDLIFAADDRGEAVYCGAGTDTAEINEGDTPDDCETVNGVAPPVYGIPTASPTAGPGPGPTPTGDSSAGTLTLRKKGGRLRKRTLRTKTTALCTASAGCRLRVTTKYGIRSRALGAGRKARVTFKVSKKAARRLRKGHKRKRKITFSLRLAAPGTLPVTGKVRVTVRI